jgi:subtilisin family serine protease
MMNHHYLSQIILAGMLASGLVLSPINTALVYCANLLDETPAAVLDTSQPDQTTPETDSEAPSSAVTAEPVDKELPAIDTPTPEPHDPAMEEVTAPAETPAPEEATDQPATETEPALVQETPQPATTEVLSTESSQTETVDQPEATEATAIPETTETSAVPTTFIPTVSTTQDSDPQVEETQAATESPLVRGKVLIQLMKNQKTDDMIALLAMLGYTAADSGTTSGALLVDVPAGKELEAVELLKSTSGISYAEPVYTASALGLVPNDTFYSLQTNLAAINAEGGWQYFTGSSGVIVAVIDTGVDLTSADFAGRLVEGYDFVNYDSTPMDDNGHGSHVAGIMAATGNNDYGIAGLDWSSKIMPVKVLDSTGHGSDLNVYRGIMYAVDHGARVINLSLGFDGYSYLVETAVNYAYQHGVTVVASSGNSGGSVTFPANLPHVIAVGAVDESENKAAYSNYGNSLDVVAPGNSIFSLTNSGFSYKTGTSMAAPQVSGLASLLKGIYPITPDQTESIIKSTSKDLGESGWDKYFGNGLIQVRDAILWLLNGLRSSEKQEQNDENEKPTPVSYPTFTPTFTPTMTPTMMPTPTVAG